MCKDPAQKVLDDRNNMVRVPTHGSVHIGESGLPLLTFSEGKDGKETYSFLLSPNMAMELAKGLMSAANYVKTTTIH